MLVTLYGIVILVNDMQLKKAASPMLVTLSGMIILVNDMQREKALSPMHVTLSGMIILVNDSQPEKEKALSPMLVIFNGGLKNVLGIITCWKSVELNFVISTESPKFLTSKPLGCPKLHPNCRKLSRIFPVNACSEQNF